MTVQDLYNILEKEIDAGNLTLNSEIVALYDTFDGMVILSYEVSKQKELLLKG